MLSQDMLQQIYQQVEQPRQPPATPIQKIQRKETTDVPQADEVEEVVPPEPSEHELYTFKENVKDWIRLDVELDRYKQEVKRMNKLIKERKAKRDLLNEGIIHFMQTYQYGDLNTSSGKIKCAVSTVKNPLVNTKTLTEKLNKYNGGNEAETARFIQFLENTRGTNKVVKLKRTAVKREMNL